MHIIQVFVMMILLGFEEKDEKYDLLIVIVEFCEIVLLQHKIQHNLINYEIRIYSVHIVTYVSKLNWIVFKENVNYDLKVLKVHNNVQLLHIITTEFGMILKTKRKKSQNNDFLFFKHMNQVMNYWVKHMQHGKQKINHVNGCLIKQIEIIIIMLMFMN